MRRAVPSVLSLLIGGLGIVPAAAQEPEPPACDQRAPVFRTPLRLGDGRGYEPSIETDSQGTIFVMAHKLSLVAESTESPRTASWLWRSTDGGQTFEDMVGLSGGTNLAWALEGDGAVDAHDRFYYVDTWAADNHFSRWSDRGATLDMWRPMVPSLEPVDDRPWVAAHGDGYVYYMSNSIGSTGMGRLVVHRSTDAGESFDPVGFGFPNSLWGFIDADPNSPYVYAFMDETSTDDMVTWVSPDRGETWTRHVVDTLTTGSASNLGFPNLAVSPVDGAVFAIYDNDERLFLAESVDRGDTWTVHDITPFEGTFAHPWVSVGPTGDVGIVFDANPQEVSGQGNFVYGMIWRRTSDCLLDPGDPGSQCTGPAAIFARLQSTAVPSQEHFIQNEITPDNRLVAPFENTAGHILFTAQEEGPNLDGTPFCGTVGSA